MMTPWVCRTTLAFVFHLALALAVQKLRFKVDRQGIVTLSYVAGVASLNLIINEPMLLCSIDGSENESTAPLARLAVNLYGQQTGQQGMAPRLEILID